MSTTTPAEILGRRDRYEVRVYDAWADLPLSALSLPLYSQTRHLVTQGSLCSVVLWDTRTDTVLAMLPLGWVDDTLVSLPRAPFGGLTSADDTPPELLVFLLDCLESWAAARNGTRLVVKLPPVAYDPARVAGQKRLLEAHGFSIEQSSLNLHIPVGVEEFSATIHVSERKRLRKCQRAGFVAEAWQEPDPDQVFDFVSESRRRQGYALSITRPQLKALLLELPDVARVFVVRDGPTIASLTVAVRVSDGILYNFCPADNLAYRAYSPTVLLDAALYAFAQREGISLIDLGVSLDHLGQEKSSLVRFKKNLGGIGSEKAIYVKAISRPF